jgi:NAD(P)-dependent dehydrogenase (short-subunit alcohol dehydrogenase family)
MHLEGKIALVTGSMDGVGRLVAFRLAGRDRPRGKQVLEQIRVTGRGSAPLKRGQKRSST